MSSIFSNLFGSICHLYLSFSHLLCQSSKAVEPFLIVLFTTCQQPNRKEFPYKVFEISIVCIFLTRRIDWNHYWFLMILFLEISELFPASAKQIFWISCSQFQYLVQNWKKKIYNYLFGKKDTLIRKTIFFFNFELDFCAE